MPAAAPVADTKKAGRSTRSSARTSRRHLAGVEEVESRNRNKQLIGGTDRAVTGGLIRPRIRGVNPAVAAASAAGREEEQAAVWTKKEVSLIFLDDGLDFSGALSVVHSVLERLFKVSKASLPTHSIHPLTLILSTFDRKDMMIRRMAAEYDPSSINFRAISGAVRGRSESEVRSRWDDVLSLSPAVPARQGGGSHAAGRGGAGSAGESSGRTPSSKASSSSSSKATPASSSASATSSQGGRGGGNTASKTGGFTTWTPDQDAMLADAVRRSGTEMRWKDIALEVPERSAKQCRERWYNHVDPTIRSGEYTRDEHRTILEFHLEKGNKWSEMAVLLPGR